MLKFKRKFRRQRVNKVRAENKIKKTRYSLRTDIPQNRVSGTHGSIEIVTEIWGRKPEEKTPHVTPRRV